MTTWRNGSRSRKRAARRSASTCNCGLSMRSSSKTASANCATAAGFVRNQSESAVRPEVSKDERPRVFLCMVRYAACVPWPELVEGSPRTASHVEAETLAHALEYASDACACLRAQQRRPKFAQIFPVAFGDRLAHFQQRTGMHAESGQAECEQQRRVARLAGHFTA